MRMHMCMCMCMCMCMYMCMHMSPRQASPPGAQPLPRVRERAAVKVAYLAAFGPPGTTTSLLHPWKDHRDIEKIMASDAWSHQRSTSLHHKVGFTEPERVEAAVWREPYP